MLVWVFTYKNVHKFKWTSIQFWISVTLEKDQAKPILCQFVNLFEFFLGHFGANMLQIQCLIDLVCNFFT